MTFNTHNTLGSVDDRDVQDNAANLDLAVNSLSQTFVDRLGVTRACLTQWSTGWVQSAITRTADTQQAKRIYAQFW